MAAKVVGVIPARLDSKRFYGKVLFNYRGKPLIQYLYEELSKSKVMDPVIIATDSDKVRLEAEKFGAEVVMTPKNMRTGSDRVAFAAKSVRGDVYVNVQGDALGLDHRDLDKAIKRFVVDSKSEYGTIARKIDNDSELNDHDAVKVVLKMNQTAGWFSRQPIPHLRHPKPGKFSKQHGFYYHIGVYFFKREALKRFASWATAVSEKAESLEQLRILENGRNIKVFITNMKTVSIDSPKDITKLGKVLKK